MGELLAQVLPLALGAAVSPVVFVAGIGVMTGERPLARGLTFACGVAIPLVVVTVAVLALGAAIELPEESERTKAMIDLVLGLVLLGLAARAVLRPPGDQGQSHGGLVADAQGRRLVELGAGLMVSNVTTFALYIPAMKQVAASSIDTVEKGVVTVIALAITMGLVLVPLAIVAVAPRAAGRVLTGAGAWLGANRRRVTIWICLVLGAYLVVKGALGL